MEQQHNLLLSILLGILFSFIFMHAYASNSPQNTPEGYWKIVDRTTGNTKSIVKIWKTHDQSLMGKVVKVFAKKSDKHIPLCTACKGDQYNKPIVGMTILSGLKSTSRQWGNGHILNPENGKVYKCAIRTVDNGNKLNVRNYVGLPFFGRAETWERVDLMSG
jgi:uncharacterized protein (DUF2147 family)